MLSASSPSAASPPAAQFFAGAQDLRPGEPIEPVSPVEPIEPIEPVSPIEPFKRNPSPRVGRTRRGPRLRIVGGTDSAADLDRRLRALSRRASRCRLVEGWLAIGLLPRRGWRPLGFVRLGDYTRERLGIGARILEDEARVARALQGLPQITLAFLDGTLTWTAVRLLVGVASLRDERSWIDKATSLDSHALAELVGKAPRPKSAAPNPEDEDVDADPPRR